VRLRGPLAGFAALVAVLAGGVAVGALIGVGPLAAPVPPDQVTDPKEMIARSLQATMDSKGVHLAITLDGTIPGEVVERAPGPFAVDGATGAVDIVPGDVATRASLRSDPLAIALDTVTVWGDAWYKAGPDGAWTSTSVGGATASAGVDLNPLTLVDRLRGFLARPDLKPSVATAPCPTTGAPCRHVVLDAGTETSDVIAKMLPDDRGTDLPPVRVLLTLDTEVATLRPQVLLVELRSDDRTVDLRLRLETSAWDQKVVIDKPVVGS
jgi:hypothetical protein